MRRIGIIDLQGGVAEHLEHLQRLGVPVARIKRAEDMEGLAGLILPGGESSCLSRLFRLYGLDLAIRERFAAGLPLWGTCAGAILMASHVDDQPGHLALMDIHVRRNAFGSQMDSFSTRAQIPAVGDGPLPLIFIRAPKITALGEGVRPLLMLDDPAAAPEDGGKSATARKQYCAAAEDAQSLATVFHPELAPDLSFHRYFCHKCGLETRPVPESDWQRDSWTHLTPIP
uniref:Pyridoxal 5'-phosphate synthase subunit PdxT n=1 Tax=Candidatus Kentrum sp. DK TaxID=2126562 RepID=A0A450S6N3_9GAMM|nr:MAG: 5'-phosphate synthase pdxT subunit [Candidatus Kentron sp. DK]